MSEPSPNPLPVNAAVIVPAEGPPHFTGLRCSNCGAVFVDEREACASCYRRGTLIREPLSSRGTIHAWTVVERSYPGVPVPYVSVIVSLDGGGTIKGNLHGVDPKPDRIHVGAAVEAKFSVAPVKDKRGNEYMIYTFIPAVAA